MKNWTELKITFGPKFQRILRFVIPNLHWKKTLLFLSTQSFIGIDLFCMLIFISKVGKFPPKKEPSYQSRTISHSPSMKFKTFDGRRVQHAFSIPKRGFDIASWSKNCTNICIHNLDSLKANPIESGVQKVAPFKREQGGR